VVTVVGGWALAFRAASCRSSAGAGGGWGGREADRPASLVLVVAEVLQRGGASVRRERLDAVILDDVTAEGFPQMTPVREVNRSE
jgi:hypothetical protein